jgi:hypothetical protein
MNILHKINKKLPSYPAFDAKAYIIRNNMMLFINSPEYCVPYKVCIGSVLK